MSTVCDFRMGWAERSCNVVRFCRYFWIYNVIVFWALISQHASLMTVSRHFRFRRYWRRLRGRCRERRFTVRRGKGRRRGAVVVGSVSRVVENRRWVRSKACRLGTFKLGRWHWVWMSSGFGWGWKESTRLRSSPLQVDSEILDSKIRWMLFARLFYDMYIYSQSFRAHHWLDLQRFGYFKVHSKIQTLCPK